MYPEGDDAGAPAPAAFPIRGRWSYHLEGLIPIILILVIAFFLAIRFGVVTESTPVLGIVAGIFGGEQPGEMLIIGETTQEVVFVLDENPDLVRYRMVSASYMERNPKEILAQYDIVMLDQSQDATKEVSRELGEAIEDYVATGGSLIVVKDSGIRRPQTYDVLGWEATFGDTVPVRCDRVREGQPTCLQPILVRGKLYPQDLDHFIMKGIEEVPSDPMNKYIDFYMFDVTTRGKEIAMVQDIYTKEYFPAIVEKSPSFVGKSLYFNYNPGKTRGIFEKTLRYLK